MNYDNLAAATITWARSPEEADRIKTTLSALSSIGITAIIAVDGGSDDICLKQLRKIKRVELIQSGGRLQDQVRISLNKAAETNATYILYTESDKLQFCQHGCDEFIRKSLKLAGGASNFGIAVAARTTKSFAEFPPFQTCTEQLTNRIIGALIDSKGDYTYGPRMIASDLIPFLDGITHDVGWGWMSYLLMIAHRLGKTVYTIPLDLACPLEEQTETLADKRYRLRQLKNHIAAIDDAMGVSLL